MYKYLLVIVLMGIANCSLAQEIVSLPSEYKDQNLRWNAFRTTNFEVLAIDAEQGRLIATHAENARRWCLIRWGFRDEPLAHKCMIMCARDQQMFKDFYHRDSVDPKLSKSKDLDGQMKDVYAIYLSNPKLVVEHINRVCLLDIEKRYKVRFGYWAQVGMSALANDTNSLKQMFGELDPNGSYLSKPIFESTGPSGNLEEDQKYRATAAAMCLLLRKQAHGADHFSKALQVYSNSGKAEQSLSVFGFNSFQHFDMSFNSYVKNLSFDIRANRTPNMGLTWYVKPSANR